MTATDRRAEARETREDSIATRQSLVCRLKNKADEASWREFFETYWNLIYRVARKAGLSDTEAQDVVQETVISVARQIEGFVYDPAVCSFKTWMLRLTRWRIINRLKAREREAVRRHESLASNDTTRTPTIERVPDPQGQELEAAWDREWEQNILETARERTKRRVNPAHYQIYDLCVHEQKPAWEVACALEVNIGRVYLARHRVGRVLKAELERLKREIERKEKGAGNRLPTMERGGRVP
jgi:RNA polymerase sigma-70 factor (ECF subfamily)